MTATAVETGTTWVAEHSWEATTLDYLSPLWYPFEGVEPFTSEEEAEAFVEAKRKAHYAESSEPRAFRARKVPAPRVYVDSDAEFSAMYWAGQAHAARQAEEARKEMFRTYGRGNKVRVFKGRKVPVGTEGTVFWLGENKFGPGYRVGFETESGEKHFTALDNVEAVAA